MKRTKNDRFTYTSTEGLVNNPKLNEKQQKQVDELMSIVKNKEQSKKKNAQNDIKIIM